MSSDHELQAWMADWAAGAERLDAPEVIREHVRRRTRLLTAWVIGELATVSIIVAFLVRYAVTNPDPIQRVTMALLVTISIGALAFSFWNWRGAWRPSADTTTEFLAVSRNRLRRFRRAARAGWIVLLAEAVVFVPWVWLRAGARWDAWAFLCAMLASGAWFLVKSARWAAREGELLDELAHELDAEL